MFFKGIIKILEIFKEKFDSLTQETVSLEAKIKENAALHEIAMSQELEKKNQEFKLFLDNSQSEVMEKYTKEIEKLQSEHESFVNLIKTDYTHKIDQLNMVSFYNQIAFFL